MEVFAWTHEDMHGIIPNDALHQLDVDPSMKLVKFTLERNAIIVEKVEKLLKARFI
jgi:hypothetical protein